MIIRVISSGGRMPDGGFSDRHETKKVTLAIQPNMNNIRFKPKFMVIKDREITHNSAIFAV